jgi:hypothetical protein
MKDKGRVALARMAECGHLPALATALPERQAKMRGHHEELATGGVNNGGDARRGSGPGTEMSWTSVSDMGQRLSSTCP